MTHLLSFDGWFLELFTGQLTLKIDGQALRRVFKKLPSLDEPSFHFFYVNNSVIRVTTGEGQLVENTVHTNQTFVQLLSLAATPFFFPVMRDAPSEHNPNSLSTDRPHSLSSSKTDLVMVAAFAESDDSLGSLHPGT